MQPEANSEVPGPMHSALTCASSVFVAGAVLDVPLFPPPMLPTGVVRRPAVTPNGMQGAKNTTEYEQVTAAAKGQGASLPAHDAEAKLPPKLNCFSS